MGRVGSYWVNFPFSEHTLPFGKEGYDGNETDSKVLCAKRHVDSWNGHGFGGCTRTRSKRYQPKGAGACASAIITAALMVAGVTVAALVRSATKKNPENFCWPVVFHKCCATIHWAFISFYLFLSDRLRTGLALRPIDWFILILVCSFVIYTMGSITTRRILEAPTPGLLSTNEEKTNVMLATLSLIIALLFARFLTIPADQPGINLTASFAPGPVTVHSCSDQSFAVSGMRAGDRISDVVPPSPLGNISFNAYTSAANTVLLHFCNPSGANVIPPAGTYSFLVVR